MSKHTEKLRKLGELSTNQWLGLGIALGGPEQVEKLLRCRKVTVTFDAGEKHAIVTAEPPEQRWEEVNGVICFTVTSHGTTGPEWLKRSPTPNFRQIDGWCEDILDSPEFKATSGVTYEVAVLTGRLFSDHARKLRKVRTDARRRNFGTPNAEVACLIREAFSDEELEAMGFRDIVVMHKSIKDREHDKMLLCVSSREEGGLLSVHEDDSLFTFERDTGFAFLLPSRRFPD